ncbi:MULTISPECIES: GIN domain-containing protein [unclassified Lentimicrobium]|uniref:GIN domain-containing protein n=1 Tax=unclassified Lentimicrobium TaxID=2677434 RepID=UPI0015577428|nr:MULTISPECIES: DUF2807 domain-containing protein [unclassified Lentimicrobium]NPD44755.1 DUF2807 domain-containing protein [Lentimicrobium sp. S6]NPD83389.1 DUF2807 domain-containing protein [Lentimicrobium sp. L6]
MEKRNALRFLKWINIFTFFILLLGLNSCKKGDPTDCFKSTGSDITQERPATTFDKIVLSDNVNLVLTQGNDYSISVHGGKNVLKKVRTDIDDRVLKIENRNSCNWMRNFDREITVYANFETINEIEYRGSGDISCTNTIVQDSLTLNIWEGAGKVEMDVEMYRNFIYFHIGTADVYYKGNTHLSYVTGSSFGPIYAQNLRSTFTYIANHGSNNCYVQANLRIEATISSLGNIYYWGDAEELVDKTGSGILIKMD